MLKLRRAGTSTELVEKIIVLDAEDRHAQSGLHPELVQEPSRVTDLLGPLRRIFAQLERSDFTTVADAQSALDRIDRRHLGKRDLEPKVAPEDQFGRLQQRFALGSLSRVADVAEGFRSQAACLV